MFAFALALTCMENFNYCCRNSGWRVGQKMSNMLIDTVIGMYVLSHVKFKAVTFLFD